MAQEPPPSPADHVDAAVLLPIVRKSLGRDIQSLGEWSSKPLAGIGGQTILLFEGATGDSEAVAWKLVLKCLDSSSGTDDPKAVRYWRREADVYECGVLDHLDGGLRAARCLALQDVGDQIWMWMPYIEDGLPERWPVQQLARAARHLGAFNAAFPEERLDDGWKWMSRSWLKGWHETEVCVYHGHYQGLLRRPEAQDVFPASTTAQVERMWGAAERVFDALESLPACLCHFDAFRRNLFADGDTTIAIDWAFTGKGAYGEDLAGLVFATIFLDGVAPTDYAELSETAYAAYLQGLREAGWAGDERDIRLAYLAHGCARLSVMVSAFACHASFVKLRAEQTGQEHTEPDPSPWQGPMEFYHANHDELFALLDAR